jgi:hypothetical protein
MPPFPPDQKATTIPDFDSSVQRFANSIQTTITGRIPTVFMYIGIAFGALVGIMLLFVLAFCFVHCIATKPYDKTKRSLYENKSIRTTEDEETTVGARAVRRVRSSAPHETRVQISL